MGDTTTVITMADIDEKLVIGFNRTMNDVLGSIEHWFADEDKFFESSKVLEMVKAFLREGNEDPVVLMHRLDMLRFEISKWTALDRMSVKDVLKYMHDNSLEKYKLLVEKINFANRANSWLSEIKNIVQGLEGKAA